MTPTVPRVLTGAFAEGPSYATWRSRGTTDWLVVHTVAGSGRFGALDGRTLLVGRGDLVLLRPGVRHDYGTAPGVPGWELQWAHVHPRAEWAPLLDWPEALPGVRRLRLAGEVHQRVREAFVRATALGHGGLAQAELFELNALETALLWAATQVPGTSPLDPRLIRVLEDVGARLAEPLTVAGLADRAGLSSSRLTHLFTEQLGVPPMRYVERQRMQAARQLLELTSRPVAEVARAVGYDDPLYFSTRFRRHTGRSPSAHRAGSTSTPPSG
ncbi:MAG: Transcriptional regulator, AraC family [uncultured Friedmanniella sp.]|uniref:Transcriptional regulator, AraC family n=1 Tax=uncultured Friedmanniella sp. TaxID=335381 RepID=A0A6J4JZW0_9ACTN|nr:MAG: Transcriptional regulator, AraC family [uncultured Friedmanniella sp.]